MPRHFVKKFVTFTLLNNRFPYEKYKVTALFYSMPLFGVYSLY